ncbi:MAG: DUF1360 domain-containing protein [Acidobacteriota bacterium]|nr:DUF1360 domain-containing protein [Acidobacteriota bacterium]
MVDWPVSFQFVVAVLATWRVAHLVAREDGPFDVIVRVRARAGDTSIGRLMDCPHCLGLWIAMPLAAWVARTPGQWLVAWLGIAGGASMAQRWLEREPHV